MGGRTTILALSEGQSGKHLHHKAWWGFLVHTILLHNTTSNFKIRWRPNEGRHKSADFSFKSFSATLKISWPNKTQSLSSGRFIWCPSSIPVPSQLRFLTRSLHTRWWCGHLVSLGRSQVPHENAKYHQIPIYWHQKHDSSSCLLRLDCRPQCLKKFNELETYEATFFKKMMLADINSGYHCRMSDCDFVRPKLW